MVHAVRSVWLGLGLGLAKAQAQDGSALALALLCLRRGVKSMGDSRVFA